MRTAGMIRALRSVWIIACITSALAETGVNAPVTDGGQTLTSTNQKVIVYYFYFYPRCETCINMELFAKEAVETGFAREMEQGTVEWHSIDIGLPEYEHFGEDFKLDTKALIMILQVNGKEVGWKNCEMIWDLVGAKPDFIHYVQTEVRSYLNHKPEEN